MNTTHVSLLILLYIQCHGSRSIAGPGAGQSDFEESGSGAGPGTIPPYPDPVPHPAPPVTSPIHFTQGQNIHFIYVCTYTTQIDTCTHYTCVHLIHHAHVHTYIIAHTYANTYTHMHVYQHPYVHPPIHTQTPSHPYSHAYGNVCDTNMMLFDIYSYFGSNSLSLHSYPSPPYRLYRRDGDGRRANISKL